MQTAIVTLIAIGAGAAVLWRVVAPWFAKSTEPACGKCDACAPGTPNEPAVKLISINSLRSSNHRANR